MGNAVWLFIAQAEWYFPCILAPLSAGALTLIPTIGIVALAIGVVLGVRAQEPGLLFFGLLAFASHVYVAIAGFLRGTVHDGNSPIFYAFLLVQIAVALFLVYRIRSARLSAMFLAIFTSSYAYFAAFIAAMSFSDTWL